MRSWVVEETVESLAGWPTWKTNLIMSLMELRLWNGFPVCGRPPQPFAWHWHTHLPRGSTDAFFLLYMLMHGPSHSVSEASMCSNFAHSNLLHYLPTFFSIWQASILFQGLSCQNHHSSSLSTSSSQTRLLTPPPLCSKCDLSLMLGISQFSITITNYLRQAPLKYARFITAPHSLGLRLVISFALGPAVRQHMQLCFSTSSCWLLLELLQPLWAPGFASTFGKSCLSLYPRGIRRRRVI